jgi:hypothetical protein
MSAAEFEFRIEGYTPETLPMERIAEYLLGFAQLLGSKDGVHFGGVEKGSVRLVAKVDQEALPVVSPRVRSAATGEGGKEARAAYARLNEMLGKDKTIAALTLPGSRVIPFPGTTPPAKPIGPLRQPTSLQGRLVRLEGNGDLVGVGIEDGSDIAGRIVVKADLAKEMATYFHTHVRLSGSGKWRRNSEGQWDLELLDVSSFEPLEDEPIGEVLRKAGQMLPEGSASQAVKAIRDLRRA